MFEEGANTVALEQRLVGKKINLPVSLTSYTKMSSNWVMDLKIKCKTKQLAGKKKHLWDLLGKGYKLISRVWSIKGKMNKLNLIKIRNVCSVAGPGKRTKRQETEWEKILVKPHSWQITSIDARKELSKLNHRTIKVRIRDRAKDMKRQLREKEEWQYACEKMFHNISH